MTAVRFSRKVPSKTHSEETHNRHIKNYCIDKNRVIFAYSKLILKKNVDLIEWIRFISKMTSD